MILKWRLGNEKTYEDHADLLVTLDADADIALLRSLEALSVHYPK